MDFKSPLASGEVVVYEISRDKPLVVRKSTVLAELPFLLGGRDARRQAVAHLLSAHEMEKVINSAMRR